MRKNEKNEIFAKFGYEAKKVAAYHEAVRRFKASNLSHQETSAGTPVSTRKTRPSRRGV